MLVQGKVKSASSVRSYTILIYKQDSTEIPLTNRDLRTIYSKEDNFLNDKKGTHFWVHLTTFRSCLSSVHGLLAVMLALPFVSSRHRKMTLSWLK